MGNNWLCKTITWKTSYLNIKYLKILFIITHVGKWKKKKKSKCLLLTWSLTTEEGPNISSHTLDSYNTCVWPGRSHAQEEDSEARGGNWEDQTVTDYFLWLCQGLDCGQQPSTQCWQRQYSLLNGPFLWQNRLARAASGLPTDSVSY